MGLRSSRVIGRESELGVLTRAIDSAAAGQGGAIFLTGEGGIGKSRLAEEAAAKALAADIPILRGRAGSIGPMVPFRPLTQALLSKFRGSGPPPDAELQPYIPVLAQLVPDWREDVLPESASLVVLAEAVYRLLAVTGRGCGCLLALDDLQGADPETLFILEYLLDNLPGGHTLLIGTLRNDPSDALRLVDSAARRPGTTRLDLAPLALADTETLAAACLETSPEQLPAGVADLLWRNSAGIPFVVEELLHGMLTAGVLVRGRDGWRTVGELRARVPAALVTSVGARVEQLGSDADTLLSVAAIVGGRFPLSVIQAVTGLDDRTLHNHLGASVDAQLLTPDDSTPGWYAFRHPLTTEALLARLNPATKARLAKAAAQALEEQFPGLPGELCALAASLRLTAADKPAAGALFAEAGNRAFAAGALESAISLLSKAFDLLADAPADDRAAVLEPLIHAHGHRGQFDEAMKLSDEFARLGTVERTTRLHTELAWAALLAQRRKDSQDLVDRARAPLGASITDSLRAGIDAVEANLVLDIPGHHRTLKAEQLARDAWRIAEAEDLPLVACRALQVLGIVAMERDLAESDDRLHRTLRIAEQHGLQHQRTQVLVYLGGQRMLVDGDTTTLQLARTDAVRTGAITLAGVADGVRAYNAVLRADYAQAAEILDHTRPIATRLRLAALLQYTAMVRAVSAAHQADRATMNSALEEFAAAGGGDAAQESVLTIGLARVFCSLLEEDVERARHELAEVSALEERSPSRYHLAGQHGLLLLFDELDGKPARPRAAVAGLRWNRVFERWAEAVRLGRQGLVKEADAAAADALAAAELYPVARHLGLRLVAEQAAEHGWGDPVSWLKEAEEYFHLTGIPAVASACRSLLRRIGAPVQQRRTGLDLVPRDLRAAGVTVREYEVLLLLAERRGNKDIAARLHISPRTVEKHVASLMQRLQSTDRTALTEYAAALRPAGP